MHGGDRDTFHPATVAARIANFDRSVDDDGATVNITVGTAAPRTASRRSWASASNLFDWDLGWTGDVRLEADRVSPLALDYIIDWVDFAVGRPRVLADIADRRTEGPFVTDDFETLAAVLNERLAYEEVASLFTAADYLGLTQLVAEIGGWIARDHPTGLRRRMAADLRIHNPSVAAEIAADDRWLRDAQP